MDIHLKCSLIDCPLQAIKSYEHDHPALISLLWSGENNSCPSHLSPTKAFNPLPYKGFRFFEDAVGSKYQENKKCPRDWKKLVEKATGGTKTERWEMSKEII